MAITGADIKYYLADGNGDIDLNTELTNLLELFAAVLDIGGDVEIKFFVKNTNGSISASIGKLYIVNGGSVTNTNNTPVDTTSMKIYEHIPLTGNYSLTFPTINTVVVTPDGGQPRAAQPIIADGATSNPVYLRDGKPVYLKFSASLTTADTAVVNISDGASFTLLSEDLNNEAVEFANRNSYSEGLNVGTLAAGATYPAWMKQVIPDGTISTGNPRRIRPIFRFTG